MKKYLNKIIQGDCLEVMKELPDNSVDMVFADPWYYPENQKISNAFQEDVFWNTTENWLKEVLRVCNGHIFISFSSKKMAKFEFLLAKLSIPVKSRIVWNYRNAGGRCADKGMFGKTYEMIYHIGFAEKLNFPEKWGDERFDVWTFAIPQSNFKDKKVHEFQKPIKLLNRIVELGSFENDTILDPFLGSGTTAVACKMLNRNYIGIEISEKYCKIAEDRLKQETLF
jgi:site-specific DNA-methyltransferase (adenine-specific)